MSPIITDIVDGETWEEALNRSILTIQMLGIMSNMSLYLPGIAAETLISLDQSVS
jgi:hypothetical protein